MEDEWKVKIVDDLSTFKRKVWIYYQRSPSRICVISDMAKGLVTEYENSGEEIPPTIIVTQGLLNALFDELQRDGLKPKSQSFIEGKLEATERHLEDIRKVAKLK